MQHFHCCLGRPCWDVEVFLFCLLINHEIRAFQHCKREVFIFGCWFPAIYICHNHIQFAFFCFFLAVYTLRVQFEWYCFNLKSSILRLVTKLNNYLTFQDGLKSSYFLPYCKEFCAGFFCLDVWLAFVCSFWLTLLPKISKHNLMFGYF